MNSGTRRFSQALALACVLFAALGAPATAQVTTAGLRGTVTDTDGLPLPGATVVATHLPSGTEYGTATGSNGTYTLPNMRVGGPYRVAVSFIGYDPFRTDDVMLSLGEAYQLDVELAASTAELGEVEVVAEGGVFDPNRTGVNRNISEAEINAIPTVGRDLADFTRLTPQAYVENDDDDGPAISIAGQNNRYNAIYIDGAVNTDVFGLSAQGTNGGQTGATPISIDAIEQFQIAITPFDVTQSGFTGGAINAVTRSGTNTFEGSAYGIFRNEGLAGSTPGAILALEPGLEAEPLPEFSNNRFGFRLGGPIVPNKLFFFTNAEFLRSESPLPFAPYTGASADRLELIRQTVRDETGYEPGDFGAKASTLDDNKLLAKLDWNISNRHRLSARHSYSRSENVDAFQSGGRTINYGNNAEVFPNTTNSTAVELNSTFGNDYANKLVLGFTRVKDDRGFAGEPFPNVAVNDGAGTIRLGSEAFSTGNLLEQDVFTATNNFNWFRGAHTLTFGANLEYYSIFNLFLRQNFGAYSYDSVEDFLQSVCAAGSGQSAYCQANYDGEGPAAPASFARGFSLVDNEIGDASDAAAAFDAFQIGVYAQDEFRASDQLRLTAGLRLDVPKIVTEPRTAPDADETVAAIAALNDLGGAEAGQPPAATFNLSPRVGFNYDVRGDRSLQLRGGAGVFLGRVPFVWPGAMYTNNGTTAGYVSTRAGVLADGSPIPFVPDPNEALTVAEIDGRSTDDLIPSGELDLFTEDFRYPRVFRTTLGADAQLPYGFVGTLEGQFTKTLSNIFARNVNIRPDAVVNLDGPDDRPVYFPTEDFNGDGETNTRDLFIDPRYSSVILAENTSRGHAWDLTARLQRRYADIIPDGDLDVNLSYTLGDAYAVNEGLSSQINSVWRYRAISDVLPNEQELTRSRFSIGQRVLAGVTFRKEFLRHLGTSASLFYTGESGRPFTYTIDRSGVMLGSIGGVDQATVYVPRDAGELVFEDVEDGPTAAEQAAAFDAFIESSDYLSGRRGQYAERNGARMPFEHIFDLKLAQELFTNLGGARRTLEVTLDVFNLGNLLNSDWGTRYERFGAAPYDVVEVLEFQRFRDPDAGDFTPVYRLDLGSVETEDELLAQQVKDSGTYSSRWLMQLGLRLTF